MTDKIEKRKHKRFRAKEGAYAVLSGSVSKMGEILDIGKNGLAFRYIDIGDRPNETCALDILCEDRGFRVENVGFRIIYDLDASKNFPFSTIPMRRCGGQFTGLSNGQIYDLEFFMERCTESEA
jgi:hypothetical protein